MYHHRRRYFPHKKRDFDEQRQIARERIQILTELIRKNPQSPYNKRYIELIKRIGRLYRIKY